MPTFDLYTTDPGDPHWQVPATGAARFAWEYDDGRERLLALYQKGKDKQWDGQKRIDWSLEVDPYDPLGTPDESISVYGTKYWAKFTDRDKESSASTSPPGSSASSCTASRARWCAPRGSWSPSPTSTPSSTRRPR